MIKRNVNLGSIVHPSTKWQLAVSSVKTQPLTQVQADLNLGLGGRTTYGAYLVSCAYLFNHVT